MNQLLLAGDIGGTKTNIAVYPASGELKPVVERSYLNCDFDGIDALLRQFHHDSGVTASAACLAVAGAVQRSCCDMPNLGWNINGALLARTFNFRYCHLLNDLAATAYGIDMLAPEQLLVINAGEADLEGNCALIAAGTGLGEAIMFRTAKACMCLHLKADMQILPLMMNNKLPCYVILKRICNT